jgi:hypothetical protein
VRKAVTLSMALVLVLAFQATAQITITTNTFMPSPGTNLQYMNDNAMNAVFYNSLTSGVGGPMLWDFSPRSYSVGFVQHVVNSASAPSIDSFPGVNLVIMSIINSDTVWSMLQSSSSVLWQKGLVSHYPGGQQIIVYKDSSADLNFPLSYGNNWVMHRRWNVVNGPLTVIYYDTIYYSANAWGTAKYNSKSISSLRLMGHERNIVKTYLSGTLYDSVLTETFTASFVASGYAILETASNLGAGASPQYIGSASSDFVSQITDVTEDGSTLPNDYALEQNYPNPFNPSTEIHFSLPRNSHVTLVVYNVLGQQVKTLVDQTLTAGSYNTSWDGTNQAGSQVASGVYLYRVEANQFAQTKKMVLLK